MAGFLRQEVALMSTTYFPQASNKGGDPLLVRLQEGYCGALARPL